MSEDENRRRREHKAREGDPQEAVRVERDMARVGEGVHGFLDELIGKQIYIEGVRINYRGTLRQVLRHGDGMPGALILQPCQRVSYFNRPGPDKNYAFTHTKPRLVPYEMVHDVGEEGFAEGEWSKIQ